MFYHFKIHKEKKGFWAECIELKGAVTQGKTIEELEKMMKEALNLYLDEPSDSRLPVPLPKKNVKGNNIVKVPVDPSIAFAIMLRHLRMKNKLTQRQIASRLGMKDIFSYQRLEKSSNPRLSTLAKIKREFPDFNVDEIIQVS